MESIRKYLARCGVGNRVQVPFVKPLQLLTLGKCIGGGVGWHGLQIGQLGQGLVSQLPQSDLDFRRGRQRQLGHRSGLLEPLQTSLTGGPIGGRATFVIRGDLPGQLLTLLQPIGGRFLMQRGQQTLRGVEVPQSRVNASQPLFGPERHTASGSCVHRICGDRRLDAGAGLAGGPRFESLGHLLQLLSTQPFQRFAGQQLMQRQDLPVQAGARSHAITLDQSSDGFDLPALNQGLEDTPLPNQGRTRRPADTDSRLGRKRWGGSVHCLGRCRYRRSRRGR